jgi:uncharacterized cupredoxin-like copper-binding protein
MAVPARRIFSLLFAILALTLVTGACSGDNEESAEASPSATSGEDTSTSETVNVTVKDYGIALDATDLSAGDANFVIANDGPSTHEFVVFKTDLAADALPVESGEVNEDDASLQSMGEVEDLEPNSTESLGLTLDEGSYVAICNLPGHYEKGMQVAFTVA